MAREKRKGEGEGLARTWRWLAIAVMVHVLDEAWNNFLVVYNPEVMRLRERYPGLPIPIFQFEWWLGGLTLGVILLLLLTRFVRRNAGWFRVPSASFAFLMMLNGFGHIVGTIAGRTFTGYEFARPMPGFWSSPLLIAAAVWYMKEQRSAVPGSWAERSAGGEY